MTRCDEKGGYLHDDEVNNEHLALVVELGDVHPAEVVRPAAVVERGHAAVVRADVEPHAPRVLPHVQREPLRVMRFYLAGASNDPIAARAHELSIRPAKLERPTSISGFKALEISMLTTWIESRGSFVASSEK